jgi:hypothetical protein
MHFAFIPVGKRSEVELFFRDLEAQKHYWLMWKKNEKTGDTATQLIATQGQLRILPFGICEYVFPREDLDIVLYSMINEKNRYGVSEFAIAMAKKFYKLKKIPDYKKTKNYLWIKDNVNVIPLGIREDGDLTEPPGNKFEGWTHEAL